MMRSVATIAIVDNIHHEIDRDYKYIDTYSWYKEKCVDIVTPLAISQLKPSNPALIFYLSLYA